MHIPPKAAIKQAELCVTLIRDLDRTVTEEGHPADQALRRHFQQHPEFGSRDRRFFSTLVFAWFRWRGWLQTPDARTCAIAALMDATEVHPTVRELARTAGCSIETLTPLAALGLTEKSARIAAWLALPDPPSPHLLVPTWLSDWLFTPPDITPADFLIRCIETFQQRPPTWLRCPSNKAPATALHAALPCATTAEAFGGTTTVDEPVLNRQGIEIQDLASQCVGPLCAPVPGERWWDVCAGAGGKTLHLADLLQRSGHILATDIRAESIRELTRRTSRYGRMVVPRLWDGRSDPAPGESFDGALVDAPCSGIGTWGRNPDARWRTHPDRMARLPALQQTLLNTAAAKIRPGGRLVYATCTLSRQENTEVLAAFLKAHANYRLDPAPHPLTGAATDGQVWIWPWQGPCNGMFIARLRHGA